MGDGWFHSVRYRCQNWGRFLVLIYLYLGIVQGRRIYLRLAVWIKIWKEGEICYLRNCFSRWVCLIFCLSHLCLLFRFEAIGFCPKRMRIRCWLFSRDCDREYHRDCSNRWDSDSLLNFFGQFCGLCLPLGPWCLESNAVLRKSLYWLQLVWVLHLQRWCLRLLPWLLGLPGIWLRSNVWFLCWWTHRFWYIYIFFLLAWLLVHRAWFYDVRRSVF